MVLHRSRGAGEPLAQVEALNHNSLNTISNGRPFSGPSHEHFPPRTQRIAGARPEARATLNVLKSFPNILAGKRLQAELAFEQERGCHESDGRVQGAEEPDGLPVIGR